MTTKRVPVEPTDKQTYAAMAASIAFMKERRITGLSPFAEYPSPIETFKVAYKAALAAAPEPPAEDGSVLPIDTVDYVLRYGGRCRDCADENGICPQSGLPCGEARKAVEWVIGAINYGLKNGFLCKPPALSRQSQEP